MNTFSNFYHISDHYHFVIEIRIYVLVFCREYLSSTLMIFFQHDKDLFHTKIVSRSTRACIPPFIRQVVSYTCGKDFFSEINLMYKNRQDDDILIWENRVFSLSMLSRTCLILKVPAQHLIPIKWWDKMNKIIINIFSNYLLK